MVTKDISKFSIRNIYHLLNYDLVYTKWSPFSDYRRKKEVAVVDIRKGAAVISILNEDAYQKKTYLTENAENPFKE